MEASWLWNRQAALREGQLQVIPTRIVVGIFSLLCAAIFFMAGLMADGVLYALLGLAATAVAQPLLYKILTQTTHQRRAIKPRSRVGLIVQGLIFLFFTFLLGYGVAPGHVNLLVLILGYLVSAGAAIVVSYWVCIPAPQKPEETEEANEMEY